MTGAAGLRKGAEAGERDPRYAAPDKAYAAKETADNPVDQRGRYLDLKSGGNTVGSACLTHPLLLRQANPGRSSHRPSSCGGRFSFLNRIGEVGKESCLTAVVVMRKA